jgi:NAD(P)-dependent dehydrogenase (short-subunit alcohol dehydrogenase family)
MGKVAVITGAADGIGRAMAERFAGAGMRVALADRNEGSLAATADDLRRSGHDVTEVVVDVTEVDQVRHLADVAYETFGGVDVLCNNAGTSTTYDPIWEQPLAEWDRVMGVNFQGVLHGVHVFTPRMLAQGTAGYLVNVASAAGLGSRAGLGPYVVSKHAVIALSECLHHDLRQRESALKVAVVCPGRVRTRISPRSWAGGAGTMEPPELANLVLDAMERGVFYVLPHPDGAKRRVRERAEAILADSLPAGSPPIV